MCVSTTACPVHYVLQAVLARYIDVNDVTLYLCNVSGLGDVDVFVRVKS